MPRLSENRRNQAIGMLQAGALVIDIAEHFGCSHKTIHNLTNRYANTGSANDRPTPGRERVTSRKDDGAITLSHLRDRFTPATVIAQCLGISAETIRCRLRWLKLPLHARRPYK